MNETLFFLELIFPASVPTSCFLPPIYFSAQLKSYLPSWVANSTFFFGPSSPMFSNKQKEAYFIVVVDLRKP